MPLVWNMLVTLTVIDRARRDGQVLEQMTLTQRHGGLGLRRTSPLEGRAAYPSAAAQAQQAMSNGPAAFRAFEGLSGDRLWPLWEGLRADEIWLWGLEAGTPDVATMPAIAHAQRTYGRNVASWRYEALLASHTTAGDDGQRAMARLRSCACHASAAWLTALPTTHALVLKTEEFCAGMQHRLGLAPLPANAVGLPCNCRTPLTAANGDHAMVCSSVQGQSSMRHDIVKGIMRRIVHRAGVASTLEPTLHRLPGLRAGVTTPAGGGDIGRLEGRGDVLMALGPGMAVVDVSVTHLAGVSNRAAPAATDGAAAAKCDVEKRRAYNRLEPNGYPFTPFSVETHGGLGKSAIALLGSLSVEAVGAAQLGAVSKSAFVRSALSELKVGLCRGNCIMYRKALGLRASRLGQGFLLGSDRPTAEVLDDTCMLECGLCVRVLAACCGHAALFVTD
jgi:hypothetical protein